MQKISNFIGHWTFTGHSRRRRAGFTMIETLVALGVLGMFFGAIVFILQQILINIGESRLRATALTLAQARMETIRNLPYNQVGTVNGIPTGPTLQNEIITLNSLDFTINTSIIYIDDPFDGIVPADLINTDYKRVRTEVTWGGVFPSRVPVTLVTNIVPKGVETISGGGTLFIRVFNAIGEPVANASVQIDNSVSNPQVHTQTLTNANGLVVLPGAPACVTCYQIVVTKNSYSADKTYAASEVANPLQPHATVIEGNVTQISFAIDSTTSFTLNTFGSQESGYPPVGNVFFTLRGSKIIGYDNDDDPVYKYQQNVNTIGNTFSRVGLEWDTYSADFTNSAHNLAGANPLIPFSLAPGSNVTIKTSVVPKTNNSLLVIVKNGAGELQTSASAILTNTSLSYNTTKYTAATGAADMGQAYFGALNQATFDLMVSLPGYQEATASVFINGNKQETVNLNTAP